MKFFAIDEAQLAKLKALASRLYIENRMNGDEMRDAAHVLMAIHRVCLELEAPETVPPAGTGVV